MRNVIRACCGLVLVCACGARSEIAGTGLVGSLDASLDGTMSDVLIHGDGSPLGGPDAGGLDGSEGACTEASVGIGCAGNKPDCDKYGCKFQVMWTCGGNQYRIGGGCGYDDAGKQGGEYWGVCVENGDTTSSFQTPTTTCDCTDASALLTVVQEKCTHQ